ncbi:hypothetical protein F5I97DRAFT_1842335 [Phlebopus sp. FC_14]|nr:hypothetical protein F5I97DRAFT_1842335 [Phlebopus sp. FC_14]
MQLTLVPSFELPRIPSQEYIFVMDRSGSMDGLPMETAKRTLAMLLRLLPTAQTAFNIISFGNNADGLWPQSRLLDQASLNDAVCMSLAPGDSESDVVRQSLHAGGMSANYGGTEIGKALRFTLQRRMKDRPTAVFVLTDGDVHDNINPMSVVASEVRSAPPHAPLRVFVLGIGPHVSSDMCERLARVGNGECLFALSEESITGKCARLLNAGRTKNIEKIEVEWDNDSFGTPTTPQQVRFSPTTTPRLPAGVVELAPPPPIQQAPQTLTRIFRGLRFTVFAITSLRSIPKSVKLLTKLEGVDVPQEQVVSVTEVKPFRDPDVELEVALVHSLAARKLIIEIGEGRGSVPVPASVVAGQMYSEDELRKAEIIRLGLEYQLVSKYTSFVAVESGNERGRARGRRDTAWIRSRRQHRRTGSLSQRSTSPEDPNASGEPGILAILTDGISSALSAAFSFFGGTVPSTSPTAAVQSHTLRNLPGAYVDSDASLDRTNRGRGLGRAHDSTDTFSTLSSLEGSPSSCWTYSRSPSPTARFIDPIERARSPDLVHNGATQPSHAPGVAQQMHSHSQPASLPPEVYDLFSLQQFDGSFACTNDLERIVGAEIVRKAADLGFETTMWTTAVAVAYLKEHMESEPDLLDTLLEKVNEFVERYGDERTFQKMVRVASGFLASPSP